jgi:hypothetical protein
MRTPVVAKPSRGGQPLVAGANRLLKRESPALRGFPKCAREDSNLHGLFVHKALNLARLPIPPQAPGAASIARPPGFRPRGEVSSEHMFARWGGSPSKEPEVWT